MTLIVVIVRSHLSSSLLVYVIFVIEAHNIYKAAEATSNETPPSDTGFIIQRPVTAKYRPCRTSGEISLTTCHTLRVVHTFLRSLA